MPHQVSTGLRLLSICVIAILAGCANTPQPAPEPLVFPPPPAEPRFVYERTLSFSDTIEKLTTSQKLQRLATGKPQDVKGLTKPYDVAVYKGKVFVTDTVKRAVVLFDIPNGRYREFGTEEPGSLTKPTGIDVSNDGELFVADVTAQRVLVFDPEGNYLRSVGDARLQRPSDVAVDTARQHLFVVDTGGVASQDHQVHIYHSKTGRYLQTIGTRGTEPGQFNLPLQATVGVDGTLYVVDSGNFRVQMFTPGGDVAGSFGSLGRYPGQFFRPKGIATDSTGNVYVVDAAFGNFQIFTADGRLLLFIGARSNVGRPANFMLPAGIHVDEDERVYVVDQYFRKVDIFRPASLPAHEGFAAWPTADQ